MFPCLNLAFIYKSLTAVFVLAREFNEHNHDRFT